MVLYCTVYNCHSRGAGTSTRSCRAAWHWAARWWCSHCTLGTTGSSSTARTRALHRMRACTTTPLPSPTRLRLVPIVRVLLRLRPCPRPLRASAGPGAAQRRPVWGRPRLTIPSPASTLTAFDSVLASGLSSAHEIRLSIYSYIYILFNVLVHLYRACLVPDN